MTDDDKKLVTDVLWGTVTPDKNAALFDDDVVYFAIRRVENQDFEWLLTQLRRAPSQVGLKQVLSVLSPEHRAQAGA